ncbi:hypothetical protein BCV70DRAFT_200402 [Testicularia cyperi]|uniref:Uncharacterized protein n=1 Tax=Testicularia cyperi TaxID=1882483 RepID=A0A317XPL7_9BASI|nr:hypothetical protein BCV70DRAFT_200402 [Testicularia cyperi]
MYATLTTRLQRKTVWNKVGQDEGEWLAKTCTYCSWTPSTSVGTADTDREASYSSPEMRSGVMAIRKDSRTGRIPKTCKKSARRSAR